MTEGVGEVYGAPRKFNRWEPIGGPPRDHICGTEDEHRHGGIYDPTRPPVTYLPSGLPTCCDADRLESVGGAGIGGAALVVTEQLRDADGGAGIGGTADVFTEVVHTSGGGLGIGTPSEEGEETEYTSDGGIGIGGTADVTTEQSYTSDGGIGVGGDAVATSEQSYDADGGVGIGGDAVATSEQSYDADGGVGIGGDATATSEQSYTADGGVGIGGDAVASSEQSYTADGGVGIGGDAATVVRSIVGITIGDPLTYTIGSQADIVLPPRSAGDTLMIWVAQDNGAMPSANTGWTRRGLAVGTTSMRHACYVRVSDGIDSTAPFTATFARPAGVIAMVLAGNGTDWSTVTGFGTGTAMSLGSNPFLANPAIAWTAFTTTTASGAPPTAIHPTTWAPIAEVTCGASGGLFGRLILAYRGYASGSPSNGATATASASNAWVGAHVTNW